MSASGAPTNVAFPPSPTHLLTATQYQGDTALTIPPFFANAGRGQHRIWGEQWDSTQPTVINWEGLEEIERSQIQLLLTTSNDWVLITPPLGKKDTSPPPFRGAKMVARASGKASRHKGWWREGKDELASYDLSEKLEQIHRQGTEAGQAYWECMDFQEEYTPLMAPTIEG